MFSYSAGCDFCATALWNYSTGEFDSFPAFFDYFIIGVSGDSIFLYVGLCVEFFYYFTARASNGIYFSCGILFRSGDSTSFFPGTGAGYHGITAFCSNAECGTACL